MIGALYKSLTIFVVLLVGVRCVPAPTLLPSPFPSQPTSMEWQDQIVYVLVPHKFYDGDPSTEGGDLVGIQIKMPYLKSLGITTVFLGSVLNPQDFREVDPKLGTNEELVQLIEEFHSTANGPRINVILDLPISILGNEHPWNKEARYFRPWNYQNPQDNLGCTSDSCEPVMMDGAALDHLFGFQIPILNPAAGMDNETGVYREVRDNIVFWLVDQYDIDGFRYVSAHNFDAAFWVKLMSDFNSRYGETKPDFFHIADVFIWPGTEKSWQVLSEEFVNETSSVGPIRMDGIYDWALISFLQDVFAKGTDANCIPGFCAHLLEHLVSPWGPEQPERLIAPVDGFSSFRDAVENGNEKEKLYLASAFLMTINRVPLINNGNEYAIDITQPGKLFANGLDQDYHENFKKLIQIRRGNAAFRRGDLTQLEPTTNIISYARQYEGETYIVILNNASASQSITIPLGSRGISCNSVQNLLLEDDQNIQLTNDSLSVTLNAWEPKIIQCE